MGNYKMLRAPAALLTAVKVIGGVAGAASAVTQVQSARRAEQDAKKAVAASNPARLAAEEAKRAEEARKTARSLLAQQQGTDAAFTLGRQGGPQPGGTRSILGGA
jgi:carboxylesterase type B